VRAVNKCTLYFLHVDDYNVLNRSYPDDCNQFLRSAISQRQGVGIAGVAMVEEMKNLTAHPADISVKAQREANRKKGRKSLWER